MRFQLLAALIFAFLVPNLFASVPAIELRGYGTINAINSFSEKKFNGVNKDEINFAKYSRVGLQVSKELENNFKFVSQLRGSGTDDYKINFDWMLINWNLNNRTNILVGKQVYPLYMLSDRLDVGYTYEWNLAPISVYGSEPLRNFNGLLIEYNLFDPSVTLDELIVEVYAGNASVSSESSGDFDGSESLFTVSGELRFLHGINIVYQNDYIKSRLAHSRLNSRIDVIVEEFGDLAQTELNGIKFLISGVTASRIPLYGDYVFYAHGSRFDYQKYFINYEITSSKFEFENRIDGTTSDPELNYYATFGSKLMSDQAVYFSLGKATTEDGGSDFEYQSIGYNKTLNLNLKFKSEIIRVDSIDGKNPYAEKNISAQWIAIVGLSAVF